MMALKKKCSSTFILFFALVAALIGEAKAGYYDDWWECVKNCCKECADCVEGCTDDFNSSHPGSTQDDKQPPDFKLLAPSTNDSTLLRGTTDTREPVYTRLSEIGDYTGMGCPVGTTPTAFPMPVYDKDGLFVVRYITVWYCIDDNTEPAN